MGFTTNTFARDSWDGSERYIKAYFDEEKCCVYIRVLQGDYEYGPVDENGYIADATIKYGNFTLVKTKAEDVEKNLTINVFDGNGHIDYQVIKDDRNVYIDFRWYPNSRINSGTLTINGTWDINGVYGTDEMAADLSISVPLSTVIKHTKTIYDVENFKTKIQFNTSSTEAFNGKGKFHLYKRNEIVVSLGVVKNTHDYTFVLDGISDYINDYTIKYEWVEPKSNLPYRSSSDKFTVDAYTFPRDVMVEYDDRERILNLSWMMTPVSGDNVVNFPYRVERWSDNDGEWTEIAALPYDQAKTSVTFQDTYFNNSDLLVTDRFKYRVKRDDDTDIWNDKISVTSSYVAISTEHMDLVPGSVKVEVADRKATITWNINSNEFWAKGSKFILTRFNTTSGGRDDIEMGKKEFLERKYVDTYINSCDRYYYGLRVKPGNDSYRTLSGIATESFVWSEIGDMVSMEASKGYFKDYVELNWVADFTKGSLDNFIVERKVHGESDELYKQIDNPVAASVSSTEYVFKDRNCVAGVVYDYRVKGILKCAENTLASALKPVSIGYIAPRGEIYGRTTFKSGQGVADVMMQLSTDANLGGVSSKFGGGEGDYVETNKILPQIGADYSLQLMVAPSEKGADGLLMQKGNLEIGLNDGHPYLKAGDKIIRSQVSLDEGKFATVAGVYKKGEDAASDSLWLYVIKEELTVTKTDIAAFEPVEGKLLVGKGFQGNIDEVRVWNLALDQETLLNDYFRYLVGNENGLILYWGFGEPVVGEVYDSSFGKINHNGNHGRMYGNVVNDRSCSPTEMKYAYMRPLSYCGKTDVSGNYRIAGIPYEGSGTEYTLTPMFGVHQFAPSSKTVVVGESTSSFNIDFVDMSSFKIQGYVYYQNSNIPVKGALFYIDGQVAAKSNGEMITSDEKGEFVISVPVGTHEVKTAKTNHTFEKGGKLVNRHGADLNYQDDLSNIKFWDTTTVKVIGKAVGGYVQYNCPTGFSLSKNNLGKEVYMEMELKDYNPLTYHILTKGDSIKTITHYVDTCDNKVTFNGGKVRIDMDESTGEFVANLLPEVYNVTSVFATGYGNQVDDVAEVLDLSNVFLENYSLHEDSVEIETATGKEIVAQTDSVGYNAEFSYEFKVNPTFTCMEVLNAEKLEDKGFFGSKADRQTFFRDGKNETEEIYFWDEEQKKYTFDYPVYKKGGWYYYRIFTYYPFYFNNDKEKGTLDVIPVQGGKVKVTNTIKQENKDLDINENGDCIYVFQAENVDVTGANGGLESLQISVVGDGQSAGESFKIEGYALGSQNKGSDFITQGPKELLYVLRDPPGSHSFATLEKGSTIVNTKTDITYGWSQDGEEVLEHMMGIKIETAIGLGFATIESMESENTIGAVVQHHEEGQEEATTVDEVTLTTSISTSDDPLYVGADGDVLVGYSTNMVLSQADEITIKHKQNLSVTDVVFKKMGDYVLCKASALNVGQRFETTFAYPQIHVEQVILPQLENTILGYLKKDMTAEEAQNEADRTNKTVYVSRLETDDPNFGLPNPGIVLKDKGEYYDIYFPSSMDKKDYIDQIDSCFTSIKNWEAVLADNERMKIKAMETYRDASENFSFQAGSAIEKSYSFSHSKIDSKSYNFTAGAGVAGTIGGDIKGFGLRFHAQEVGMKVGGDSSEDETTESSTYSFTLADEGDYDYLSVDVINMADNPKKGADMVFRLRGGATACPYEGEQYTKYFEPGQHKLSEGSLRIESPEIQAEPAEVFNVPSNNPAVFKLQMTNKSETGSSVWLTLSLVDESIPHGAKLSIDGVPLSDGRTFLVPADDYLVKTLEVRAGDGYDYENMQLVLGSQCQCDPTGFQEVISDTVSLSAHFIPTSTEVHFKTPGNNWTLNTECAQEEGKYYLPIVIHDYDINYRGFDRIEIQYKPKSESKQWQVLKTFYKNREDVQDPKREEWIDKNITLTANFFGDEDQNYDIRAVSYCNYSLDGSESNQEVTYVSEVISGIKDTKLPVLFGNPLPADGILDVDDEVRLNFSEEIAEGYLTPSNFEVTGIRNGVKSDHSVSVHLNGQSDFITTEHDKNLSGKSLTAEMWVMPDDLNRAGTFFAHGKGNQVFEFGMDGQGHLVVRLGDVSYTTQTVELKVGEWSHIMVCYDAEAKSLLAYHNFENMVLHEDVVAMYEGVGLYQFGRNAAGEDYYRGNLHDFRLWDAVVSIDRIKENSLKVLSGLETSLMLYYPMNEGRGDELTEKARGNTAILKGTWNTPEGRAVSFSGESYMAINSSELAIRADQNYTLEFWFKTNEETAENQTLMCNGMADGTDVKWVNGEIVKEDPKSLFYIGFDDDDQLFFRNNNRVITLDGDFSDREWHHLAVTVNRNAENAQIYMDGSLNQYFKTDSLGGMSGAYIFVGASGKFEPETGAFVHGAHFNGNVDEIRLWNSHMTQNDINRNANVRANSKELGLMAHYPFEKYITNSANIKELVFTTDEMVGNGKYTADLQSGAAETTEKAPLKSKGTETSILHNFVVNGDALIITLIEPEDRIEKTIVNFAVKDVRDVNGNKMDGTIRWSAYVDRNQLRWSEQEVCIDKLQYEPMEFEVDLNNVGGSIKTYSIEGLPAWLDAEPSSGEIGPKDREHILFTINEGTNVGTYDDVIYAVGENGVTEPLNIQVKVNGIKPDWDVDPADYEYSMNIFGKMRFEGIFSADKEDMLAAFQNGECIGVANSSYDKAQDMWYTFLTVYNNQPQSKEVEFRMWDASTGRVYDATSESAIEFVSGSIAGTAKEPIVFDGKELLFQNIKLAAGWNWISFNLNDGNLNDVDRVLKNGRWMDGDLIKDNTSDKFASYSGGSWKSSGLGFTNVGSYLLYTQNEQVLNTSGSEVDVTATVVPVATGRWNYIGYLPIVNMTVKEALAGYDAQENDVLRSQDQFAMFSGKSWIGNLKYMENGKGYMLKRVSGGDTGFHYPTVEGSLSSGSRKINKVIYQNRRYEGGMNMIAQSEVVTSDDRILTFVNGELRGIGEYVSTDKGGLNFINIAGQKRGDRIVFALERAGEIVAYANNVVRYNSNEVIGTISNPYKLDFRARENKTTVYPVPFEDELNVQVSAENGDEIQISVLNTVGQVVYSCQEIMPYDGTYVIKWNGRQSDGNVCREGVYLIQVEINGVAETFKVKKLD